jgi:hypothetical protein
MGGPSMLSGTCCPPASAPAFPAPNHCRRLRSALLHAPALLLDLHRSWLVTAGVVASQDGGSDAGMSAACHAQHVVRCTPYPLLYRHQWTAERPSMERYSRHPLRGILAACLPAWGCLTVQQKQKYRSSEGWFCSQQPQKTGIRQSNVMIYSPKP